MAQYVRRVAEGVCEVVERDAWIYAIRVFMSNPNEKGLNMSVTVLTALCRGLVNASATKGETP
jgi:hypothetical protein